MHKKGSDGGCIIFKDCVTRTHFRSYSPGCFKARLSVARSRRLNVAGRFSCKTSWKTSSQSASKLAPNSCDCTCLSKVAFLPALRCGMESMNSNIVTIDTCKTRMSSTASCLNQHIKRVYLKSWLYSKQDGCVHINTARLPSAGTVCYSLSGRLGSFVYLSAWTADQHVGLHLTADQPQTWLCLMQKVRG